MIKNILLAGCSLTAPAPDSGFTIEKQASCHWPFLLCQHYGCEYTNIAQGGISNFEIFLRTVQQCDQQRYDLVIVNWTSLARRMIHFADHNVDDATGLLPSQVFGFNAEHPAVTDLHRLHFGYFQNDYVDLKQWLLCAHALAGYLHHRHQPFVFIKGFDNFVNEFTSSVQTVHEKIKPMLDFDQRPDDYIKSKIELIQHLVNQQNSSDWLNLHSDSFMSMQIDRADDGQHPGADSNKKLLDKLLAHIYSVNLLAKV